MAQPFAIEFLVYLVTCSATGKSYVGQTRQKLNYRWNHHKCIARKDAGIGCSALHAAIRKYGEHAFSISVIGSYLTQDAANAAEEAEIYIRGTLSPGGYNLKEGGRVSGHSAETIAKMRLSAIARGNVRPGYKHPPEVKAKIGASNKGRGRPSGWNHDQETKAKMSFGLRAASIR